MTNKPDTLGGDEVGLLRMRLAQIASGDYKLCGHTAEQVAASALLEANEISALSTPARLSEEEIAKIIEPYARSGPVISAQVAARFAARALLAASFTPTEEK